MKTLAIVFGVVTLFAGVLFGDDSVAAESIVKDLVKRENMTLGMDFEHKTFTSLVVIPGNSVKNPSLTVLRTASLLRGVGEMARFVHTKTAESEGVVSESASMKIGEARVLVGRKTRDKKGLAITTQFIKLKRDDETGSNLAAVWLDGEVISNISSSVTVDKLLGILGAGTAKVALKSEVFVTKDGVIKPVAPNSATDGNVSNGKVNRAIKENGDKFSYAALVTISL